MNKHLNSKNWNCNFGVVLVWQISLLWSMKISYAINYLPLSSSSSLFHYQHHYHNIIISRYVPCLSQWTGSWDIVPSAVSSDCLDSWSEPGPAVSWRHFLSLGSLCWSQQQGTEITHRKKSYKTWTILCNNRLNILTVIFIEYMTSWNYR